MKRLITFAFFVSLLVATTLHAQPPDSLNYMPIYIGNEYQFNYDGNFYCKSIQKDTVYPNGKRYFFTPFYWVPVRVDSTGNIWSAECLINGIKGNQDEYLIFKADAREGEKWVHTYLDYSFPDSVVIECIFDDSITYFGRRIKAKAYWIERMCINYDYLAEGIGSIIFSMGDRGVTFTNYAKINGKEYGWLVKVENKEINPLPAFLVSQNYPNPFNGMTNIEIQVPKNGGNEVCTIWLYDILGKLVYTDNISVRDKTIYKLDTDKLGLPGGVYIYQVQSGEISVSRKLLLLK